MRYDIILSAEAEDDFRQLKANLGSTVRAALERFLRHQPTRTSKSRIKRLRELAHPQYCLRVGDLRVFYDVMETTVDVLAIIAKADADAWLARVGARNETSPALGSEE
jgi:mRNA interferase RelE/StbE